MARLSTEAFMDTDLYNRILDARAAVPPPTPLDYSAGLSAWLGCEVYLKCEHLQAIGSFKIRGASNKIRLLTPDQRRAGVTTASTGNHGKAVACAGRAAGVAATVYVAKDTAPAKIDAIRACGAEVVVVDGPPIDAELKARADALAQGKTYISPYNDRDVMAGQGTMGLELIEQRHDLDAVFLSVGGGGLIGGLGTAVKTLRPATQIVGVWPENAPAMLRSLEAGRIVEAEEKPTLSTSTAGAVEQGSVSFDVCRQVIDMTVEVSEAGIAAAMRAIAQYDQWMVEGAAGVPLAGLVRQKDAWRGKKVAIIICGRNIALETFLAAVA
jgi:threonine dehydratase